MILPVDRTATTNEVALHQIAPTGFFLQKKMKLLFFFLESPKRPLKSRWEMLKFKFSHDQDITRYFEFCHLTFLAKVQSVWSV